MIFSALKIAAVGAVMALAVVVGVESVVQTVAPSGDFSLLAEIPFRAVSAESVAPATFTASVAGALAPQPSVEVEPSMQTSDQHSVILKKTRVEEVAPAEVPTPVVASSTSEAASTTVILAEKQESVSAPKECSFASAQFPNYRNLVINEIAWMGTPEDSGNEWIELKNISTLPIDIGGYWVIDQKEQIKVQLPSVTLPSDGFFLLERGDDAVPGKKADVIYTGALSNTNEALRLFDLNCFLVDSVEAAPSWPAGNSGEKRSMERAANLEWFTYSGSGADQIFGTPAAPNTAPSTLAESAPRLAPAPSDVPATSNASSTSAASAAPPTSTSSPPSILITEVFVGSEQSSDDEFIELYNAGDAAVDLTGWSIKKKSSTGSESSLVSSARLEGKSIPAHSFFLIAHEGKYLGGASLDATWASSYNLAYTNNAITLYKPDGGAMDSTSWSEITKGQSWARQPQKDAVFVAAMSSPRY